MKNFNEQPFLEDLSQVNWREIINNSSNIYDAVQNWTNIFTLILNKHAPVLNRRVSDRYTPWLNSDFFKLTKMRDKLELHAIKSKSKILMDSYSQIRNQVNKLNVQLKREYFSSKIEHCNGNRPFQRGLGRRATFLEDGGYTGIISAMLNWSCRGKSCERSMEFKSSYMVHERPEGVQHENKYLLIT